LENFKIVFEDIAKDKGGLRIALNNTLITWTFSTLLMFPLSILWSYFIYKKLRLGSFYRIIFYIPSIISSVALAAIFKYLIVADGPIGHLYELLYPDRLMPIFLKEKEYAMKTVLIYVFWTGFGGNLILLNGAMGRIPKEVIESAYMDGTGMWREIFYFVLPLCWPTLSTLIIFSFAGLFTASGPILLLTNGAADTDTISFWIYREVEYSDLNIYVPAALGWVFTIIGLPIILIIRKFINKIYDDVEF
jgi:ABC-type sugar transport system permease subunit